MKKIIINNLNLSDDITEILDWENRYAGSDGLENIKHFVLEDNAYLSLAEVIDVNYQKFAIGGDERKFALAFRDEANKLLGFTLNSIIDLDTTSPELLIQYVVINPEHQGKGIAKQALSSLLSDPQKYYGYDVKKSFAKIDRFNVMSRKLFESLGFELYCTNSNFLSAIRDENTQEKY